MDPSMACPRGKTMHSSQQCPVQRWQSNRIHIPLHLVTPMPHGGERPPIRLAGAHVSCRMCARMERKVKMGDPFYALWPLQCGIENLHAHTDETSADTVPLRYPAVHQMHRIAK
jgi:hypothetical protein